MNKNIGKLFTYIAYILSIFSFTIQDLHLLPIYLW